MTPIPRHTSVQTARPGSLRGFRHREEEDLTKAFIEATKTEPFVSVARKSEVIVGESLTGQALADHLKKLNASYEQLIKEAGLYKSEKK